MLSWRSLRIVVAVVVLACGCTGSSTPTAPSRPSSGQSGSSTAGILTELTLSEASIGAGQEATGTLTVTPPVPAAPMTIALAISGSSASVPASVTVPSGQSTATFTITTTSVTADTDVTVTARYGDVERTSALRLRAAATDSGPLAGLTASNDDVIGGDDTSLLLRLGEPAPAGGLAIGLKSDTAEVSVPSRVIVPAGATSASIKLQTFPVTVEKEARVTATAVATLRARKGAVATVAGQMTIVLRLLPPANDSDNGDDGEGDDDGDDDAPIESEPPTVASLTPASAAQGTTVAVTLTGTNLIDGASVAVSGTGVTATNVDVVDATTLTAEFTVSGLATTGARDVTVTTSAGTTDAQTFTVVLPDPPTLDAVPVMPATSLDGSIIGVTINGTNFIAGATSVTMSGGITVDNIVVTSPTSITADFGNLKASFAMTEGMLLNPPFQLTVTTSGGSDTKTATIGARITGDRSFEGFENSKCIQTTLVSLPLPGSETEMFLSSLPLVGTLYHFDENHPFLRGAEFELDDVFTSSLARLCFVPDPDNPPETSEGVYASFNYKTRSRTVVGTIEWTATVSIFVNKIYLPPGL